MSKEELDNIQGGAGQYPAARQCLRGSRTMSEEEPDNVWLLDNIHGAGQCLRSRTMSEPDNVRAENFMPGGGGG